MSLCTKNFGGVKLRLLHLSRFEGFWKIRLLLWSIWKGVRLRLKVFCVVSVGWRSSLAVTYFLSV